MSTHTVIVLMITEQQHHWDACLEKGVPGVAFEWLRFHDCNMGTTDGTDVSALVRPRVNVWGFHIRLSADREKK